MSRILKPTALADSLQDAGLYGVVRSYQQADGTYQEHSWEQYMSEFPPGSSSGENASRRIETRKVIDLTDTVRDTLQSDEGRAIRSIDLLSEIQRSNDPFLRRFYDSLTRRNHQGVTPTGEVLEYTPRRWRLDEKLSVPRTIKLYAIENSLCVAADSPLRVDGNGVLNTMSVGYNVWSDSTNAFVEVIDAKQDLGRCNRAGAYTLSIPLASQPFDVSHRRDPVGPYFIQIKFQFDPATMFREQHS
ncbi:hypothetical protein HYW21_02120 [Candidatus Woesearchaeota archaeon]|nr:hypothetical protein [Candidatus Woesearchaeota archaeon]